jgi:DNA repair protein RecN (Recombination protein N)
MLSHLIVKNVALIDHVELSLQPGLTVLTGETGAGKSILVEALLLLLGQRASADVVRQGVSEGVVEAQFCLSGEPLREVTALLAAADLPPLEDGTLVLRRVLSREGRHKQQVNGALCTVAQLRAVAEPLVDFTGQHAHQQLLRPAAALPMLDGYAGLDDDVAAMAAAFAAAAATAAELAGLRVKEAEKERRLDVLRFYLDEIETLDPQSGEDAGLELERRKLANASRLRDSLAEARALIVDGDDDVLTRAQQAQQALARAERDDPELGPIARSLD